MLALDVKFGLGWVYADPDSGACNIHIAQAGRLLWEWPWSSSKLPIETLVTQNGANGFISYQRCEDGDNSDVTVLLGYKFCVLTITQY